MNIIITGHTKGIGKALADVFASANHTVIGVSRSNGYDISKLDSRTDIIKLAENAEVFINNAYDPVGQTALLNDIILAWHGAPKHIINISSKLVFFEGDETMFGEYIPQKRLQNKICMDRQTTAYPHILNVLSGLVDTDMSTPVFDSPSMAPIDLAKLIYTVITMPGVQVSELVVDVPGLDWKNIKFK
jgi:hypothetical protein